jgi:chromosome segregation protein
MKLTHLRIAGFKSFVDQVEFVIEPGLTGIVGPNGCGKSNLVEALRWVMGENSHKNMRASGMDDVIFAGSANRPARNHADVTLVIDNTARTAPAIFNETDTLEVSRRIAREEGSVYRVNGKEVRARDVQLLFADAATGARSPAMVRQGQIAEIIAARPQARRRILEDAAGIAGLHSRRHEAELRLKAAEDNLLRLEDVLREIESGIDSLRRQVRQADRYRDLSARIRHAEATLAGLAFLSAREEAARAEAAIAGTLRDLADATALQTARARDQAVAAAAMPSLRERAAAAQAALQRLEVARDGLDAQEKQARDRLLDLERRAAEIARDRERETAQAADARATLERLASEIAELARAGEGDAAIREEAQIAFVAREAEAAETESALGAIQTGLAELRARRAAQERLIRDGEARLARAQAERQRAERDLAAATSDEIARDLAQSRAAAADADRVAADADRAAQAARQSLASAREAEAAAREPLNAAERAHERLDAEIRALRTLLAPPSGQRHRPVLDAIAVDEGWETALAAALGDDLDASTAPGAPVFWSETTPGLDDPPLPSGLMRLADVTRAPAAMQRRLRQIGLVTRAEGPALAPGLRPGQRLVSREGDLWRWDGLVAAGDAPAPAARRLEQRNRLVVLEREQTSARATLDAARIAMELRRTAMREATTGEAQAQETLRRARRQQDEARAALARCEKRAADQEARLAALREALARLTAADREAQAGLAEARAADAALPQAQSLEQTLAARQAQAQAARSALALARAALDALRREAAARHDRQRALEGDRAAWQERAGRAGAVLAELDARASEVEREREALADVPAAIAAHRQALSREIETARTALREVHDDLARAETALAQADRAALLALEQLSRIREARAAAQARCEAAIARRDEMAQRIADSFEEKAEDLLARLDLIRDVPSAPAVEADLLRVRAERERLGAVNLRASEELREIEEKRDTLVQEREDLTQAIRRLRQAIGNLNREGRERLLAAFDVVNGHFQALFATLFGGGEARLTLIDAEDPLDAGLEILARPPGKKPQTMTLLSGGEQALTATALIFAVFLTNPSPICVLDEVDAPLDDANVERFCDLLADMVRRTQTRFITITHNPITMARMNRLFGVTMAERGVSTLVSVDLEAAERFLEAG